GAGAGALPPPRRYGLWAKRWLGAWSSSAQLRGLVRGLTLLTPESDSIAASGGRLGDAVGAVHGISGRAAGAQAGELQGGGSLRAEAGARELPAARLCQYRHRAQMARDCRRCAGQGDLARAHRLAQAAGDG